MGEAWTGTQETCLPAACSDASQLWDCDNTLGLSFHIYRVWGEDQTTRKRDNARSQKAFQENGGSVLPQEKWGTLGILRIGDVRLMWKVLDGYEFSLYTRHYNPRLSDCYKKKGCLQAMFPLRRARGSNHPRVPTLCCKLRSPGQL